MSRIVRPLLAVSTLVAVVAAAGAYLGLRASLPVLDGRLAVAGLSGRVLIERDDHGVPTIQAATRDALAYGTGFVHAQDRYFQMDLLRRRSAGELAALVGGAALAPDRRHRLHRFRDRAKQVLAKLPPGHLALLKAYTDGVNAGLDSLAARPFEYFALNAAPLPWRVEDTVLVGYSMFIELNDEQADRDIRRGLAREALPAEVFRWMYPDGSSFDAPLDGELLAAADMPGDDVIDLRPLRIAAAAAVREDGSDGALVGSNNWAVAGRLTESGRAIVANDMHLGLSTPNIWYRARLIRTGAAPLDVSGVTLPGAPVVVAGSNGSVAWALTNSRGDWTDAVLLESGEAPGTYRTPSGDTAFETRTETIEVKGGAAVELPVRETIWGPVREDAGYPAGEIAISWIAHHAEAVNFSHIELESAATVGEAIAVANTIGIPPQNFVVGDSVGNIGWTIAGRIPRRGSAPADFPGDWSQGAGWQGWLPAQDYPRVVNPPGGRIWTANARVVGGKALARIGDGGYNLGARGRQIRDSLFEQAVFTPGDMLNVHLDDRALFLARWRELLLEVLDEEAVRRDAGRAEFRKLVEDWIPRASTESVGYRLVRGFRDSVRERVFGMLSAPVTNRYGADTPLRRSSRFEEPLWDVVSRRPPHLLPAPYTSWREVLLEAVDGNVAYYEQNFDGGLAARSWGERNRAAFLHPLSRAVPALSAWLDMPADALAGDAHMPRVQSPTYGASERFAVAPGDETSGYLHMPAGQSGHPLSDYYSKGHDAWRQGRLSSFLPGPPVHRLTLTPAP